AYAQFDSALAHSRIITLRQVRDEIMAIRRARSFQQFLFRRIQSAIQNILANCAIEKKGFLADNANLRAQRFERNSGDALSINSNPAGTCLIKRWHQVDQRGFAGTRRSDQRHNFSGTGMKRYMAQHDTLWVVTEADIFINDFAANWFAQILAGQAIRA